MKTSKLILIAATLIGASMVSTLSAEQKSQPKKEHTWSVEEGDSVMIKTECRRYLTGEEPSVWVWDRVHIVHQLGTRKFPEGVLLWRIRSWICEDCLINVNGHAEEAAAKASEEQAEEKAIYNSTPEAQRALAEEARQEAREAAAPKKYPVKSGTRPKRKKKEPIKQNYDRFTMGLRGGVGSLMHHASIGNWTYGGNAAFDMQYAHYWAKDGRATDVGLIFGVGVGYVHSGLMVDRDSTAFTADGVDYTVVAKKIREMDRAIQVEVPFMFSLIHESGLFFNIGPKFMMPVYSSYTQTVDQNNTHITAYFPGEGITMTDNIVTGKYTGQQPKESNGIQFNINVMVTAEIGGEWILKSGNSFGLGVYANYSVFNTYKNTTSTTGLFNLTAPTETSIAKLDVLSATKTYVDKLGYFDAGIKLAYHFNFPKKKLLKRKH